MLRFAGSTGLPVIQNVGGGETDPSAEAGKKPVTFGHRGEGGERVPAKQAERAGVGLDGIIAERTEDAVKEIETDAAQSAVGARAADRANDLGTTPPGGHDFRDELGRILQIGIEGNDRVGVGRHGAGEAGGEGGLKTEVAGEFDEFPAGIGGGVGADHVGGAIAAAVVDENGAPGAGVRGVGEDRAEAGEEHG